MAKRNVLHKNLFEDFQKWLVADGWEILQTSNNPYEALRAKKAGNQFPLIIFYCSNEEYLTFADRDMAVVGAFLRDRKKPQTNADRIRNMTDEELEVFLCNITSDDEGCDSCLAWKYCHKGHTGFLDWLKAESEG